MKATGCGRTKMIAGLDKTATSCERCGATVEHDIMVTAGLVQCFETIEPDDANAARAHVAREFEQTHGFLLLVPKGKRVLTRIPSPSAPAPWSRDWYAPHRDDIGRAIGTLANVTWDRALGYPLERPKSLTTAMLEEMAANK